MVKVPDRGYDGVSRLTGVDPDLIAVMVAAAKVFALTNPGRFVRFTEGLRSRQRQLELVADKKSQTVNSRHLVGKALDVAIIEADGRALWDFGDYRSLYLIAEDIAEEMGVFIVWGGHWSSFPDGCHFEVVTARDGSDEVKTVGRQTRRLDR